MLCRAINPRPTRLCCAWYSRGYNTPHMIQITQLTKRYGDTAVFANVTLQVAAGEFVAIVGESGVGKSTLLNCMAGLDSWDSGSVQVGRDDLGHMNAEQLAVWRRSAVGFVFQAFHVLPHLDVAQNIGLPLMLLAQPKALIAQRVAQMLSAVGLEQLGARLPQQLSGGQLQRVAIARALVHRPALVLADEPTGNLDTATAAKVMDTLIAQTREHGSAMVLVTHSEAAAARADRVLHLTAHGIAPSI
jgi:putative ABC transport system ATP-binding protein